MNNKNHATGQISCIKIRELMRKKFNPEKVKINETYIFYKGEKVLFDYDLFMLYCLLPEWMINIEFENIDE